MSDWTPPKPVDDIENEVIERVLFYMVGSSNEEIAQEAIREFRRSISKEGYVFYTP